MSRLNIDPNQGGYLSQNFESQFKTLVGTSYHIKQTGHQLGKPWIQGIRNCKKFFLPNRTHVTKFTITWPNHWLLDCYVRALINRSQGHLKRAIFLNSLTILSTSTFLQACMKIWARFEFLNI
jgi:hypothetical protein